MGVHEKRLAAFKASTSTQAALKPHEMKRDAASKPGKAIGDSGVERDGVRYWYNRLIMRSCNYGLCRLLVR